ncbi:MAG TPA: hypothetical protein VFB38_16470 [Chthonomonadaceae bacterium]|nr:hypothetical protein [Chthonomonadaceae bacterium]
MRHRTTHLILLVIGMAAIYNASPAYPQQETPPAEAASKALYQSDFDSDPRLSVPMTIEMRSCPHWQLWARLARKTRLSIDREEAANELDSSTIAIAGKNVSARALMDAMAARVMARWERTEKGYRLLVSQRELDDVYLPQSNRERERFAIGAAFIRDFNALPASEQARLLSGRSVPFTSLPAAMQQAVSRMLESLALEYREKGMSDTVPPSRLSDAMFRLERKPAPGFNRLFMTVRIPEIGSTGWRLNDYEAQKQARQQRVAGGPDPIYAPVKFEVKPEDAKRLPALKRVVTLQMWQATFPEALQRLHEKYGLAFVSDPKQYMSQQANINIPPMPLGEALDWLTEIFRDTEWEWRKYGFVVVRGPLNPSRTPRQPQPAQDANASEKPAPPKPAP